MQLVFARGRIASATVSAEKLFINNCGYYLGLKENMPMERERGRADYHLVFVYKGEMRSNLGKAVAGECLYYPPNVPQRYEYSAGEKTAYFWIHYSGAACEELFGGATAGIIRCGAHAAQIHELFLRTVHAISNPFPESERYALGIFQAICALVRGGEKENTPFRSVISMMEDFPKNYGVADYAEKAKMSRGHFIRSFKAFTGKTPIEYRTDLMIAHAKNLLLETSLNVGIIGELSGFSDGLYFSKIFKKRVGLSPTDFRKVNAT